MRTAMICSAADERVGQGGGGGELEGALEHAPLAAGVDLEEDVPPGGREDEVHGRVDEAERLEEAAEALGHVGGEGAGRPPALAGEAEPPVDLTALGA